MSTISSAALRRWARNDVITDRRLAALGLSRAEIRTLVRREHLLRAHEGVFFLGADPDRRAIWTAATARCAPEGLLSHASAAALWELIDRDDGRPHVTVPRGRRARQHGIRIHWTTRPLNPALREGIPVTTLHRTLDDYARSATDHAVKRALRQAEYHHALDLALLHAEARSGRLRRVLAAYVPGQGRTDSAREADFFELSPPARRCRGRRCSRARPEAGRTSCGTVSG